MDFNLTADQQRRRDAARKFAEQQLAPGYRRREQQGGIEPRIRIQMGQSGFIAPEVPPTYGGRGLDRLTSGMLVEEISRGDFSVAYLQVVGSLVAQVLVENATPELAASWVPKICAGEEVVGIGLTEPHAGSDAANPHLRARRDGDEYVLDGTKSLSFAAEAAAAVVFARTDEQQSGSKGISAFLVPLDLPGVTREPYSDMGTKAVGRGAVHFQRTRIPADHLLGREGEGFSQVMKGFDFSRALIGLQCLGAAQVTVDETWEHVTRRQAFGQPLSKFQGVSFPLAEAETVLSAARLLCYQTLWLKDQGAPHTAQAAMCKWWAPKTAFEVIQDCLLLHGQYGYRTDLPIEQRLRDVLGLQIGDGTAQIMKLVVARQRVGRALAP
ncbi:MAG: acyl-CoA dehydrogenase family protein [Saccharopolyspora rectivirgula]|jgi:cyclohexanecarboxyl-CoA dehydrogenase|uniref:acyl-CoA dehydrogenase family protein n=1 Tax=Saccharopolyspora rectivirgula TaxID=28042 RepID=UPI00240983BD|nr:acyl-CoA dehydrogenase family protein [Saccharopolyspora rectivirgula]